MQGRWEVYEPLAEKHLITRWQISLASRWRRPLSCPGLAIGNVLGHAMFSIRLKRPAAPSHVRSMTNLLRRTRADVTTCLL